MDDTLINTTQLNNDAYNYALQRFGYPKVCGDKRITKQSLNFVMNCDKKKIIKLKQKYFMKKWIRFRTIVNRALLDKLKIFGKKNCFLWTKANKRRAKFLLKTLKLNLYFKDVIYDKKDSFAFSMLRLSHVSKSNEFIIYENDFDFFDGKNVTIFFENPSSLFNIKGYFICMNNL